MNVNGKIIVVTGAGSGIGRALVEKFVAEGARQVVAVDINSGNAQQTANDYGCVAMTADVSRDEDIKRVVEETESSIGPIDLFCSNAGVGMGLSEQSPDREWQMSWDINVMSHVYAARHLVPRMIERGGGYFLNTASAAGLLNQVGGAAYGVSKHAAVGFGEWLALTYAHQGIKVSMLCPQIQLVPGLLPEVSKSLQRFQKTISGQHVASLEKTPEEYRTPCYLVDQVYNKGVYYNKGLPIQEWHSNEKRRQLMNFEEAEVDAAIFKIPQEYRQYSLN